MCQMIIFFFSSDEMRDKDLHWIHQWDRMVVRDAHEEIHLPIQVLFSWYIDHPFPFLVNNETKMSYVHTIDRHLVFRSDSTCSDICLRISIKFRLTASVRWAFCLFEMIGCVNRCPSSHSTQVTVKSKQRLAFQHGQETSIDHFQSEVSPALASSHGNGTAETNILRMTPLGCLWNGKKREKRNSFLLLLLGFFKKTSFETNFTSSSLSSHYFNVKKGNCQMMAKDKAARTITTLRTRHISCFFFIAVSFFIVAVILFALSAEESKALGASKNRVPVIISASFILILSLVIVVWNTVYAVRYFRLKKHQQSHRVQTSGNPGAVSSTSVVVFDNAAFTTDDSLAIDRVTNASTARWWTKKITSTQTHRANHASVDIVISLYWMEKPRYSDCCWRFCLILFPCRHRRPVA